MKLFLAILLFVAGSAYGQYTNTSTNTPFLPGTLTNYFRLPVVLSNTVTIQSNLTVYGTTTSSNTTITGTLAVNSNSTFSGSNYMSGNLVINRSNLLIQEVFTGTLTFTNGMFTNGVYAGATNTLCITNGSLSNITTP